MRKQYMRQSLNNSNELLFFSTVWTLLWKASYSFWYLVVFRNSSPILLKDIQSSFLDVGCILLHTALIMLSFRLKGAQSMTDSVSLWAQDHCHPVKWSCSQSDPLQMVLHVDPNIMVVFSVRDSNNFDKISDTTGWNGPKHVRTPTKFYRLLLTLTAVSLLTSSVHIDHQLNQKFQIWIYHSLRHIATYFQYSSCIIWCTSVSSLGFLFLWIASWQTHEFLQQALSNKVPKDTI